LTPTGVGTVIQGGRIKDPNGGGDLIHIEEKPVINVDNKDYLLEKQLRGDIALIHAWKADKMGNVVYHRTARNFNQIWATAADWVIVEAETIVEVGELDPDQIMTPGALVDQVVQAEKGE
jgi:acetate CoA/acetoacetate CoA-transferase alpha subunit